eukprot:Phypoly_transcript_14626.p1 GENE.Phypoly_transcript_14626~~Phypoly_transcript_14626.p1  ORF type:complete len:319 (-),score=53.20 Phypoly_transcript_14626:24-938(-)
MAIVKPYLSALAQILIVTPLTLILSVVLAIASVISAYLAPTKLLEPKTILITGGSSGIGKSLAEQYAKQGITLILLGRDQRRLQEVANLCQSKGACVFTKSIDITNRENMEDFIQEAETKYKIDLIVANAGVNSETLGKPNAPTEDLVYELFDANITGVLNTIVPIIPLFKAKKQGQIAIVSSLMAYIVDKGPYAASKACVTHLGQCLRLELEHHNIQVSVIAPPYIPSKMTEKLIHKQPKFLIMGAEDFAALVQQQLAENRPIISPFKMFTPALLPHYIPPALFEFINRNSVFRRLFGRKKQD